MTYNSFSIEARRKEKMLTDDRVLTLKVMDGKKAKDSNGVIDGRLFNGSNRLHGIYDERTGMWNLRYETGSLPGELQVKFVSFKELEDFARRYFKTRNVEITDVISV